ncbi:hypothetical protein HU175_22320 [Spirosoma sp. KUDC1026]|nr:hypothetical protein HU175_22320 [Spirosoma sp. KUDC1026]
MSLTDKAKWDSWKANNDDDYGRGIFAFAEVWGRLMQIEIAAGLSVADAAHKMQYEPSYLGITGFMFGAAVNVLSQCWEHGEALRQWHNERWGRKGADGVVNPASFSIKPMPRAGI